MTVREILKMGDPRLLRVAPPVPAHLIGSSELADLIVDMEDTMRAAHGAGLAAPQIGVDLQVVIFGSVEVQDADTAADADQPPRNRVPRTTLINPVIEPMGIEMEGDWEGCLSVPGLRGMVPRYHRIRYRGLAPDGSAIDRIVDGFHARVVQHECDHLIGVLYPMRIRDFSCFGFTDALFPGADIGDDE